MSKTTRINIGEESITDFNLLILKDKHPQEIQTVKCTKPIEAKEGADWEWWLGCNDHWLGLRVQAKKIDMANLNYPYLNHVTRYGNQIDLLIRHSINHQPPMIPIYVFYNYWDTYQFDPPWLCRTYSKNVEMLGCGITEAGSVKPLIARGIDGLRDISPMMYPWSCLVCCRGFSKGEVKLPFRAFEFLSNAFKEHRKDDLIPYEREKFVVKEAPSYVYRILEGLELSEKDWSSMAVNRVTVIYEAKGES